MKISHTLLAVCTALVLTSPVLAQDHSQEDMKKRMNQMRATMKEKLLAEYDLSDPRIDLELLMAPGVPKDGIPALTKPKRIKASGAGYPKDDGRVIEVQINGDAVAYPLGILNYHEIINDELAGVPIAATYCPLCDSVSVLDRRLDLGQGKTTILEFGVSGFLYNSNVVMYERNSNTLWSQVLMQAVTGPNAGKSLTHLPVRVISFADFKKAHPDGEVVSRDTGYPDRPYDRNIYAERGYFTSDRIFQDFKFDHRLPAKALGLGIFDGKDTWFVLAEAAFDGPITVQTSQGAVVVEAGPAGVRVDQSPEGVSVIQTFYHSWAGYHPLTKIVPESAIQKVEDAEDDASTTSSN